MDYETDDLLVREVDDVIVARLKAENLNGHMEIQRISGELDQIIARGTKKLVFDFKYVEYAGSAALGMLIAVQKKLNAAGGKMIVSHSEKLDKLLTVSRTKSLFKLAADPRAAFKMF